MAFTEAARARRTDDASAGVRLLDPAVLARIGDLELLARTVVDGFVSGLHRAPHLGVSSDFAEYRAYMPGDDIRRIDWRQYGRTDRFYVKEFEADTNASCWCVVDVSRSMSYGSRAITKLDYARYLAASLAYFCHRQRDRVGLATFAEDIVDLVPASAAHLPLVLHTLDRMRPAQQGTLQAPLRKLAETIRRRSILVVISDLYDEPDRIVEAIARLRHEGHDVIVIHVLDPAELELPSGGAAEFEDLETGERLAVIPDDLRTRYRSLIAEHRATVARRLGEQRIDYAFFDTSVPLDHALFEFLAERQRLAQVR